MVVKRSDKFIDSNDLKAGDVFLFQHHVCLRIDKGAYERELDDSFKIFFVDLEDNQLNAINENNNIMVEIVEAEVVCK